MLAYRKRSVAKVLSHLGPLRNRGPVNLTAATAVGAFKPLLAPFFGELRESDRLYCSGCRQACTPLLAPFFAGVGEKGISSAKTGRNVRENRAERPRRTCKRTDHPYTPGNRPALTV